MQSKGFVNRAIQTGIAGLVCLSAATSTLAQDHSSHQQHHPAGIVEMDVDGKRLQSYEVRHNMDQETLAALRARIALYRGMSDMELNMNMSAMGPNYEWYASDLNKRGEIGVLILSHGVGQNSDRMLKDSFQPIADRWPTAIGFGMAMMQSAYLQTAVDDLVDRGAKTIVLVPSGTTTQHNTLTRQWKYIFDLDDEQATYLEVPKITSDVPFLMAAHFGDDQLITDILYEHAKQVSQNPAQEVVIIVGHGPEDIQDNGPDLEILQAHAERIRAMNEFADVKIINLQDDAIPPIRESNVRKLRRWVKQAVDRDQTPIVVALASASHGLQAHIRQDLRGLQYTFADRGLSENPKYVAWIQVVIEDVLAKQPLAPLD